MIIYKSSKNCEVSSRFWPTVFQTIHTHTYWEIIFICKGSLINSLDNKEREMHVYDIALVKPENVHKLIPSPHEECEYYNIIVSDKYIKRTCNAIYVGLYEELRAESDLYATIPPLLHNKLLSILSNANNSLSEELCLKFNKIAYSYLLPEFIPIRESLSITVVSQVLEIMSLPKNMSMTIKSIAKQIGYTPEHLTRLFKKAGINSPHETFLSFKMKHALALLCETDMPIADISYSIGIFSLSYFYKIFKKYYKKTPSEIRNHHKQD